MRKKRIASFQIRDGLELVAAHRARKEEANIPLEQIVEELGIDIEEAKRLADSLPDDDFEVEWIEDEGIERKD